MNTERKIAAGGAPLYRTHETRDNLPHGHANAWRTDDLQSADARHA
jgi:hypothetical protein